MAEALAALLITIYLVVMGIAIYRAGQQSSHRCCYRGWGHDGLQPPDPPIPGIHLERHVHKQA